MTVAMPGDFGKPLPALVVQSSQFTDTATVTALLLSGTLVNATLLRLDVEPRQENGLRKRSQVMVDKAMTVKRDKPGEPFGRLDDETTVAVNRALVIARCETSELFDAIEESLHQIPLPVDPRRKGEGSPSAGLRRQRARGACS